MSPITVSDGHESDTAASPTPSLRSPYYALSTRASARSSPSRRPDQHGRAEVRSAYGCRIINGERISCVARRTAFGLEGGV
jgi:hypothetical protein